MFGDMSRGKSQTALAGGCMTGCINSRSVIKNGQERQARGVMDSDAFILPDYIHGCAFRSHHGHTHGSISARSPLGRGLFFFPLQSSSRSRAFSDWLIYFIFFYPGGLPVLSVCLIFSMSQVKNELDARWDF